MKRLVWKFKTSVFIPFAGVVTIEMPKIIINVNFSLEYMIIVHCMSVAGHSHLNLILENIQVMRNETGGKQN